MPQTEEKNRVTDLFIDKTVLITGGTGFLGKVLIEKLLRLCPKIRKIYVLVRPKGDKSGSDRLKDIFNGPLFEVVKKQEGKSIFQKVEAIPGDLSAPNLGLSEKNRKRLIEETEMIHHSGASVRFDEPLKKAVLLNVRGTKLMLDLAKECKKLMVFCHISTAYCHEDQEVLYEKIYPSNVDPCEIVKMCEMMDEDALNKIAKQIRGVSANNYTFTKALAETLIGDNMDKLPLVMLRPSAVLPIWNDPVPGWSDNLNGPTGLLIGAGKGVIRTMYARGDYYLDYVPVDSVAGTIMCCSYDYVTHKSRRIFNITTSDEIQITFQEIIERGRHIVRTKIPFSLFLWYPGGSITQSRIYHLIRFFLFQLLPAAFLDLILYVFGFKPFLLRVQKKIWYGYEMLEYYANRQWHFKKDNAIAAKELFNAKEIATFGLCSKSFCLDKYAEDFIRGARSFILKEKESDIPAALKRMKVMRFVDLLCKTVITALLIYFAYKYLIEFPFYSSFKQRQNLQTTSLYTS